MLPHQLQSSPRSITVDTAGLLHVGAIVATEATQAVAVTYVGALLTGDHVLGAPQVAWPRPGAAGVVFPAGHQGLNQYPIARAGASAGSYVNGSTLTFVGMYGGLAATSVATVVGTDGAADFIGNSPLDRVTSVIVQAQVNGAGSWTLGFTDLACRDSKQPFRALRVNAAGNVNVAYEGGFDDLIPFLAGEIQFIEPFRVRQATTTAASFTIYE